MSAWDDLVDATKAIEAMPQEAWMHARQDPDGRWNVIEKGLAPRGWRDLSWSNELFRIEHHNPIEPGDRIVVGEAIYVVNEDRHLEPYERDPGPPACDDCGEHHEGYSDCPSPPPNGRRAD